MGILRTSKGRKPPMDKMTTGLCRKETEKITIIPIARKRWNKKKKEGESQGGVEGNRINRTESAKPHRFLSFCFILPFNLR
mmetsp:Transcript_60602/g.69168  ORF Transcript_60602/g.69168 Transcript_60602/m.69168 type:complete len:81 (+) Transcript_60602:518-760(+)